MQNSWFVTNLFKLRLVAIAFTQLSECDMVNMGKRKSFYNKQVLFKQLALFVV